MPLLRPISSAPALMPQRVARTLARATPALTGALVLAACAPDAPDADLVIRGASVLDVATGTLAAPQDLFIAGDRITLIAAAGELEPRAETRVVEAEGRTVIPGLWDAHVHSAAATDWHFPLLLAHGVTSVRNLHTSLPDPLGAVDSIAQAVSTGSLLGPRFLANGPLIDDVPSIQPGAVEVADAAAARAAVDSLADAGARFIKVYDNLSPELFRVVVEQAASRGLPVDGHLPLGVTAQEAAAAGMRTIEHGMALTLGCSTDAEAITAERVAQLEGPPLPFPQNMMAWFGLVARANATADPGLCLQAARALADAGVAVTPTLVNGRSMLDPFETMASDDADALLPAALRAEWQAQAGSPEEQGFLATMGPVAEAGERDFAVLREAGVTLLAGTDIGNAYLVPGRSVHHELALMVELGLSPIEALRTATLHPARVFGMADSLGMVETGYLADLVLLEGNPADDIAQVGRVIGVVRAGRWLDRSELDAAVEAALGGG